MSRNKQRRLYTIQAWCSQCDYKLTESVARYERMSRAHVAACVLSTLPCLSCKGAMYPVIGFEGGGDLPRKPHPDNPLYNRYQLENAWKARRYHQQLPKLRERIERLKREVEKRSLLQRQRREEIDGTTYVWDVNRHNLSRVSETQMDLILRNTFRLLHAFTNYHPAYRPPISLYLKERPIITGQFQDKLPRSIRKTKSGEWEIGEE